MDQHQLAYVEILTDQIEATLGSEAAQAVRKLVKAHRAYLAQSGEGRPPEVRKREWIEQEQPDLLRAVLAWAADYPEVFVTIEPLPVTQVGLNAGVGMRYRDRAGMEIFPDRELHYLREDLEPFVRNQLDRLLFRLITRRLD
jgi:hypothetical protein